MLCSKNGGVAPCVISSTKRLVKYNAVTKKVHNGSNIIHEVFEKLRRAGLNDAEIIEEVSDELSELKVSDGPSEMEVELQSAAAQHNITTM